MRLRGIMKLSDTKFHIFFTALDVGSSVFLLVSGRGDTPHSAHIVDAVFDLLWTSKGVVIVTTFVTIMSR